MERQQPRANGGFDNRLVEFDVQLKHLVHERALPKNDGELAIGGAELRDECLSLRERQACREMRGETLEMADGEGELAAVALGHRRDREALLPVVA